MTDRRRFQIMQSLLLNELMRSLRNNYTSPFSNEELYQLLDEINEVNWEDE